MLYIENVAKFSHLQTSDKIVIPRFGMNYGFAFSIPFLIL